jgi:hypothetical protein
MTERQEHREGTMPAWDCYDDEDDGDDDGSEFEFDCARDQHGFCGKAGSEECDFECPYRDLLK